jgi:hypothetical protein
MGSPVRPFFFLPDDSVPRAVMYFLDDHHVFLLKRGNLIRTALFFEPFLRIFDRRCGVMSYAPIEMTRVHLMTHATVKPHCILHGGLG